jgi:hypothetical protein
MFGVIAAWDWGLAFDGAVAFGTLALAAATFMLGRRTRESVDATREEVEAAQAQARTAQAALDSQTAPLLTGVPPGLGQEVEGRDIHSGEAASWRDQGEIVVQNVRKGDAKGVYFSVPFRNVGNGIALVQEIQVILSAGTPYVGVSRNPALPPGEQTRAYLSATRDKSSWTEADQTYTNPSPFCVLIGYGDAAGSSRGALRLDVSPRSRGGVTSWHVRQVHFGDSIETALSAPRVSSFPVD